VPGRPAPAAGFASAGLAYDPAAVPEGSPTVTSREHLEEIDGIPVFWRTAPGDEPPVLYVHGVPTSSDLWRPFLERTGGIAPDLPGFGRSAKRADGDYTIAGYRRFLERFLDHLGVNRFRLVVQDWGGVGLLLAQARPEQVERLVIFNCVPFLPGYRWHLLARIWRTPVVGELAMGATTKAGLRLLSRTATATPGPLPADMVDWVHQQFDQGTQRAILRLYRSSPPQALAAAGADLARIEAPALVLWSQDDPFLPPSFGAAYAQRLPNAQLREVEGAGHFPWLDRPELIAEAADFLDAG
jgi:pimeloyl-ACP methyl ester carboxylesterase